MLDIVLGRRIARARSRILDDPDRYELVTLTFDHLEENWPGLGRLLEQQVFGDLGMAELATLHGVAEGTIRVRLHRARQRAAAFVRAHQAESS